jgi:hypothetical protein
MLISSSICHSRRASIRQVSSPACALRASFVCADEEFVSPLDYIDSIRARAEPFGICRIVPPAGWKCPFAIRDNNFQFQTRVQKLNLLDGDTRAKLHFMDQLRKYLAQVRFGHDIVFGDCLSWSGRGRA